MYKDRHARVEQKCENCESIFMARVERVNKGQGRFCSLKCANIFQQNDISSNVWGFENGKKYWDGKKWIIRWYDAQGQHTTSYAKWWWISNVGEISDGYVISYIDGNYENISPDNFQCISKADINKKNAQFSVGVFGPKWSDEQKKKIGDRLRKAWKDGKFSHLLRENHHHWSGGSKKVYPQEFYDIRDFILDRDEYTCQICGKRLDTPKFTHVHHRDGNKNHNNQENLISLCIHCHGKVHAKNKTSPAILALRSELS